MKEQIINNVQAVRLRRHMTQEELAKAVCVSRQTIIAIEKGNYTPSVLLAIKIARTFNMSVEKVFSIKG